MPIHPKTSIEEMVRDSMFSLVKSKTGITTLRQIKMLEYFVTFRKHEGRTKISSVFIKRKIIKQFEKVTSREIKFSGASNNEFINFLEKRGAQPVSKKKYILENL